MTHIINNIYLGSIHDAESLDFIKDNKIKTIVSIINEDTKLSINTSNISHHRYNVEDFPTEANKLFNYLPEIYNIIDSTKDNILIHCMVGASRSATSVIYYIMRKYNIKSFEKVFTKVQSKRSIVKLINHGFRDILTKYENNLVIDHKLEESDISEYDDYLLEEFLFTKK